MMSNHQIIEMTGAQRSVEPICCRTVSSAAVAGRRWLLSTSRHQVTLMKIYCIALLGALCFVSGCGDHSVSREREYNQQHAQENLDKFRRIFAQLDSAVQVGMAYSNAAAILKVQPGIMKRDDGTFDAHFTYMPLSLDYATYNWLTNGFALRVSNDIVISKDYSYSSKR